MRVLQLFLSVFMVTLLGCSTDAFSSSLSSPKTDVIFTWSVNCDDQLYEIKGVVKSGWKGNSEHTVETITKKNAVSGDEALKLSRKVKSVLKAIDFPVFFCEQRDLGIFQADKKNWREPDPSHFIYLAKDGFHLASE